jgi:hypothetical protein
MCFSETTKLNVKKQADFTCCWCTDPRNKIEVHHIIPRADEGPDNEDNAAPLCGNCHTLYGGNPELRKEIRLRRDHWFETCLKRREFAWSPNLHIPLLDSCETMVPLDEKTTFGTTIREGQPRFRFLTREGNHGVPPLQISIGYSPELSGGHEYPRTLSIRIEMPFGLSFNLEVCAERYWDIAGFMDTLRNEKDIWMLKGHPNEDSSIDPMYQPRDYFMLTRMNDGENRLVMRTSLPTESSIVFRARFTDEVLIAFANYLDEKGFTRQEAV